MNFLVQYIQRNKSLKFSIFFINDFVICIAATYLSLVLRYESFQLSLYQFFYSLIISFLCYVFLVFIFKIYFQLHRFFNYNSIKFYLKIFIYYLLILISTIFIANFFFLIPRSFPIINSVFFFILIILNRYFISLFINNGNSITNKKRCIIYGSKNSISRLINNISNNYKIFSIILLDDDSLDMMNGIKISNEEKILDIIKIKKINTFIVATDDNFKFNKKKYIKLLFDFNISLLNFDKNNNFSNISNQIDIGSLLFRNEIYSNLDINLKNEVILVTGGAGSIGSEISFQLIKYNPSEIIILDNSELNLFNFNKKLDSYINKEFNTKISLCLCDISKIEELKHVIKNKKISRVFHCAAFKHVPIVEYNIFSALKNNFVATYDLINFLIKIDIDKFTLISTDKAVRPTNIMGASKRLAELSALYLNKMIKHNTKISIVRFGNVLESSGSVVPEFRDQILSGGPVTVTHPEITRYFMSLEEAALLVIQTSQLSKGGEIFLLDMGKPIKITDLAKKMIKLSGKSIKNNNEEYGDIEIIFSGLRPGEKLYEELLVDRKSKKTSHDFIFQSVENEIDNKSFEDLLNDLKICIDSRDTKKIKILLKNRFIGYINDIDT